MDWLEALGQMSPEKALATILSAIVAGIATAVLKAKRDARKETEKMQRVPASVPPTSKLPSPPAVPRSPSPLPHRLELFTENEQLRLALRRERWRADEAERLTRELAEDQARTAAALSAERAAHAVTRESLGRYRHEGGEVIVVERDQLPTPRAGMPRYRSSWPTK